MNLRQNDIQRTVHAPAKINLLLEVLGRRADGFHELATLMAPIRWFDSLTFEHTPVLSGHPGEISLQVRSAAALGQVPKGTDNIIVKALEQLRIRSGCQLGANIRLVKRIPMAAGLGGGSSDAAAALQLANHGWELGWSTERLSAVAAEIGSDVPFFLARGAAICRGRGEQVERIPATVPLQLVIVKPPAALATYDVYQALDESQSLPNAATATNNALDRLTKALRRGNFARIHEWMANRLQAAAALLTPWVDRVRTAFAALDFLAHQLTGSGTAYFGICRHPQHARRVAQVLRTQQLGFVYVTRTCR